MTLNHSVFDEPVDQAIEDLSTYFLERQEAMTAESARYKAMAVLLKRFAQMVEDSPLVNGAPIS